CHWRGRCMRSATRLDILGTELAYVVLAAARQVEAAGHRVVHLEIGEPDMPTPPHVVEAGARALRDGLTRYALPAAVPALRAAPSGPHSGCAAQPDRWGRGPGRCRAPRRAGRAAWSVGDFGRGLRAGRLWRGVRQHRAPPGTGRADGDRRRLLQTLLADGLAA